MFSSVLYAGVGNKLTIWAEERQNAGAIKPSSAQKLITKQTSRLPGHFACWTFAFIRAFELLPQYLFINYPFPDFNEAAIWHLLALWRHAFKSWSFLSPLLSQPLMISSSVRLSDAKIDRISCPDQGHFSFLVVANYSESFGRKYSSCQSDHPNGTISETVEPTRRFILFLQAETGKYGKKM